MKPKDLNDGSINLHKYVFFVSPNIWNENHLYKFRWLAMILLYTVSVFIWTQLFTAVAFAVMLLINKSMIAHRTYVIFQIGFYVTIFFGPLIGLFSFLEFKKRAKERAVCHINKPPT